MAHGGQRGKQRRRRVAQQVHQLVARLLLVELDDPRVEAVQVTDVEVSPDLRVAKVYYVLLDAREANEEAQRGLDRAKGFIKRELGEQLSLRYVPELTFCYDTSVERGRRMEELLGGLEIAPRAEGGEQG